MSMDKIDKGAITQYYIYESRNKHNCKPRKEVYIVQRRKNHDYK